MRPHMGREGGPSIVGARLEHSHGPPAHVHVRATHIQRLCECSWLPWRLIWLPCWHEGPTVLACAAGIIAATTAHQPVGS